MGSEIGGGDPDTLDGVLAGGTGAEPAKGDGNGSPAKYPAWMEQLPDDIKGNPDKAAKLAQFAKIGDLAGRYAELAEAAERSVVIPDDKTSDGDRQAFWRRLGRPDKPDGYSFDDAEGKLKQLAYDSNLTDEQAKKIFGALKDMGVDYVRGQEAAKKQLLETTDAALRKEYGSRYTEKIRMLKKGIDAHGGNELGRVLQESGVLYHPAVVKLFIALGESGSEPRQPLKNEGQADTYVPTSQGGSFKFKGLTGAKT